MGLRIATLDDLPMLIEIGRRFHEEAPHWRGLRYSPGRVYDLLRPLIEQPHGFLRVVERDGAIVGGMAGTLTNALLSDALIAYEICLFLLPEARGGVTAARLVLAFRDWGIANGAVWVQAGTSTGFEPERTARLYERLGFRRNVIGLEYRNHGT